MVTNQKATGKAMSIPGGLAVGVTTSLITMMLCICLLAALIDREVLQWKQIGYGIMLVLLASSAIGSVVSCHKIKHQILLVGVLSGSIFYMMLLGITALFFGGQYEAVGVTALLTIGGSIAASLLTAGGGKAGKGRKNRKFHR